MISFDTETTGIDWRHGSRPYFITTCNEAGETTYWEWDVDPENREVDVQQDDLDAITEVLSKAKGIVGQNLKFDVHAMASVDLLVGRWPWGKTQDTLIAAHLLASNQPHNLTDLAIQYLGVDIEPYEKALEKATQEGRRWCRGHLKSWAIAKQGRPDMPSAKESTWKIDGWLPRTLRQLEDHGPEEWDTVLADYANADSSVSLALWQAMEEELHRRGLWEIYHERMKIPRVIWGMEHRGIAVSKSRLMELKSRYEEDLKVTEATLYKIAEMYGVECESCGGLSKRCGACKGTGKTAYPLKLPKAGNNKSLTTFIFDHLKLPVVGYTDAGFPSLDKQAMSTYLTTLPKDGDQRSFVEALTNKRKRDTSISYLESYQRFWTPSANDKTGEWYYLHSSLNQTGTDTLRMSSSNPNQQNVDKHPDNLGYSLRRVFGPAPGREWWPVDYQNIELRIPTFESLEEDLMDVFLRPNDPPYYGSYHLVVFEVLHPKLFAEHGAKCKDLFESTWYQWVKNGNFAILYGAMEKLADATYHVPGATAKIKGRFSKLAELSNRLYAFAQKHGYVETIPDKTVNPNRGYPILCSRSEYGEVLPTVPLNYHVQSTAMYCTAKAMVRCQEQLDEWKKDGFDAWIAIQVHDEIVFDLPAGGKKNLPRIRKLQKLMDQSGDDIGVPLRTSAKWCPNNWSQHEVPK